MNKKGKVLRAILSIALCFFATLNLSACKEDDDNNEIFLQYYNSKIELYKTQNALYSAGEVDAVFLGDSLTDGYNLATYYPDLKVLNRGIAGDTTVGLEDRLQVSCYDVKPKAVVMLIGANNMDKMMDNYERILIGFRDNIPESKIILLSLTSMSGEWGKKNQLAAYNNVRIKLLAEKYGYAFVDLYTPLMNANTGEIYAEYTTDGGHLTAKGYEVLTSQISPVLSQAIA